MNRGIVVSIILIVIGSTALVLARWYLGTQEGQTARDIERMSNIQRIQYGFERLHLDTADYSGAANGGGCEKGSNVRTCDIGMFVHELKRIADPGEYAYVVAETPTEDSFVIQFALEGSYRGFSEGLHTLTQDGIQ